jgi:hypothetical protein
MQSFKYHPIGQEPVRIGTLLLILWLLIMINWKVPIKYKLAQQIVFNKKHPNSHVSRSVECKNSPSFKIFGSGPTPTCTTLGPLTNL